MVVESDADIRQKTAVYHKLKADKHTLKQNENCALNVLMPISNSSLLFSISFTKYLSSVDAAATLIATVPWMSYFSFPLQIIYPKESIKI